MQMENGKEKAIMDKGAGCSDNETARRSGGCSGIVHGGDIYRNNVTLDFSVNLNPEPAPEEIMTAALRGLELMHNYPDPLQEELRAAIGGMTGAAAEEADESRSGRPDRASALSFVPNPSRSVSRAESDSSPKSCRSSGTAMDSFFTGIT